MKPLGVRYWLSLPPAERARLYDLPVPEFRAALLKLYGTGLRVDRGPIFYVWPVLPIRFPEGDALVVSEEEARAGLPGVVFSVAELQKLGDRAAFAAAYALKARFNGTVV